jgi:hypothetical protein
MPNHLKPKHLIIASAVLVIIVFLVWIRWQMAIDSCLDLGGRWDYSKNECDQ